MGKYLTGMDGDKYPFRCRTAALYGSCSSSCSSISRCFSSGARAYPQFSFTSKRHFEVCGDELGLEVYSKRLELTCVKQITIDPCKLSAVGLRNWFKGQDTGDGLVQVGLLSTEYNRQYIIHCYSLPPLRLPQPLPHYYCERMPTS